MAFDSTTRNRLAHFVGACRKLLCGDFKTPGGEMARLLAQYGIQPDGTAMDIEAIPDLDENQRETARVLREILDHKRANAPKAKVWGKFDPAVYDLLQEQGFTILNRLCALRMAEERGIVLPCVAKGTQSDGFQLFEYHSGKADPTFTIETRYQHFVQSMFDELSLDLGALFYRFSTEGLLFPGSDALTELLAEINHAELSALWGEDETIGWIYQYWNSKEERKAMRDASSAPRNSRELAVRNQFFTPRYVVEFLTDNTLGRIWYEMTKGETRLTEQCRYLVRRPSEIFLKEGEEAPEPPGGETEESLSQEELLKQHVHIPHRAVKDPREIRLLDPACGSMHFGLYAFDLFEAIYEEAWDKAHCPDLREAYPEKADYLRDIPRLIIEHNIHGVDIDPRAVQIAGLSLWLRAQKTWKDNPASKRPRVRRSNIVCAEPMPGSEAMLEDFALTLDPPLLGELVKTVFDKMQLAGEAGTLIKIEEEIRTAIDTAAQQAEEQRDDLFGRDLATDEDFFDTAEERIYAALRDYAESAEAGGYQRRLFAEDAAHGFAFIDLCRKRYEAVVMNPPFGEWSKQFKTQSKTRYPHSYNDILGAFVERGGQLLQLQGRVGAITSRTCFFLSSFANWRKVIALGQLKPEVLADLGHGVMDAAMVEAAAYVLSSNPQKSGDPEFVSMRILSAKDKQSVLGASIRNLCDSDFDPAIYVKSLSSIRKLPNSVFAYWISPSASLAYERMSMFESESREARIGPSTGDDNRWMRLFWEVPICPINEERKWNWLNKGGSYSPYYYAYHLVADWSESRETFHGFCGRKGRPIERPNGLPWFFRPGLSWALRTTSRASFRILPAGFIFTHKGPSAFVAGNDATDLLSLIALCNSSAFRALMDVQLAAATSAARAYEAGVIQKTPVPPMEDETKKMLASCAFECWSATASLARELETDPYFIPKTKHVSTKDKIGEQIHQNQSKIDAICSRLYRFQSESSTGLELDSKLEPESDEKIDVPLEDSGSNVSSQDSIVSYSVGACLGRWDIRYATGERQPPELPDPFEPLPVCPPGMLQNADGLPAAQSDAPADYPLTITWPGILVSDPGHINSEGSSEDIVVRVRDALAVIWGDRSAAIEQEACEILGVRSLCDYLAEKKSGGKFFNDHLKRYSKSRRQAPIYWPLSTESGSYTLWIYYHRLNDDILYDCVTRFVAPKQEQVKKTFDKLAAKEGRTKKEDKELESARDLIAELGTFRKELERIAKFWKPNLNDGVQITAAPLWNLFRLAKWRKKLKETWEKLEAGEYDWAHLAHSIWPERVIPKCAEDRSLAIAHGYEEALWEKVETTSGRGKKIKMVWQPKADAADITARLVKEVTSQ